MSRDTLESAITSAPPDMAEWLRNQPSLDAAWQACDRADWLLSLALRDEPSPARKKAIVAAAAVALAFSDAPGISRGKLDLVDAWGRDDPSDDDPTGLRATIWSLIIAGAVAIAVELWLYFRPYEAIRSMRRETISFPIFLVLAFMLRFVFRAAFRRAWTARVRAYSVEKGEAEIFPRLRNAVERSRPATRVEMADAFRKRLSWKSAR